MVGQALEQCHKSSSDSFVVIKQEREPFALGPRVFRFGSRHRRALGARGGSVRAARQHKLVKNVESRRLCVRRSLGLRCGLVWASKHSGANALNDSAAATDPHLLTEVKEQFTHAATRVAATQVTMELWRPWHGVCAAICRHRLVMHASKCAFDDCHASTPLSEKGRHVVHRPQVTHSVKKAHTDPRCDAALQRHSNRKASAHTDDV